MAIATLPDIGTAGGVKTIQDLYELIAGKTTSESGSTQTVSGGIDQAGMDAMLKSALESTNGLAQVSQGQRTAGGYGSAVNTMLTNDLMTRTAGQIAASNISKTTTVSPSTKTVGGVTTQGLGTSAGFLGALQALNQTGAAGWLKKNVFNSESDAPIIEGNPQYSSAPIDNVASAGGPLTYSAGDSGGQAITPVIDTAQFVSETPELQAQGDFTPVDSAPVVEDTSMPAEFQALGEFQPLEFFADGGTVNGAHPMVKSYADGGKVAAKKPSVLGTSQFNSVVDPRQGLAGSGSGVNPDGTAQVTSSPTSSGTLGNSGGGGGSHVGANLGNVMAGTGTKSDVQGLSAGLGVIGRILSNSALTNAGTLGQIASSNNPLQAAGETAINAASGGVYGKVKSLAGVVNNPGVTNVTNALASLNLPAAIVNGLLSMAGQPSLGSQLSTVVSNNMEGDPLDNMLAINNDFGTSSGTVGPGNGGGQSAGEFKGTGETGSTDPSGMGTMGGGGDSEGGVRSADGGPISGPGTETSDSIHAMLSDGEFVLSADVVDAIGLDKLQALQDKYHTPAAVQKLKAFGKR